MSATNCRSFNDLPFRAGLALQTETAPLLPRSIEVVVDSSANVHVREKKLSGGVRDAGAHSSPRAPEGEHRWGLGRHL